MSNSNSSAASRVISLNSLGRDRSPGRRILGECRDQLTSSLCLWLHDVAAPISEELFVLADSTRERLQQTRYLDLRADIEKDWSHLVESFRRELSKQTERCQNQENTDESKADGVLNIPDFDGLQLLGDDDLSEHIVLREFAAQLSESCDEELYTLDRRVATLLGHDDLEKSMNPLAPPIICDALSDACATIGPDAEARLILMRRVERHLHLALPGIYQKINANLIERGILPDLKRNYRRNAAKTEPLTGHGNSTASAPNASVPLAQSSGQSRAPTAINEGILDALQRLAQARAVQMPAGIVGFSQSGNTFATGSATSADFHGPAVDGAMINQLLLTSLNELQHAPIAGPSASGGAIVNQVRMVRDSEDAKKVSGFEAVTIDIVAMLFDFIFDDGHVPVAVKALISRLQIPVLKVAMLNPSFFADRQHPTRRFLGSISGISLRWGDAVDESDPFYAKLAELVERIQAEFENDVEIFGTALAELESFLSENEVEEDGTALTAANIVMQREVEADAWERAQRAIKNFRAEHTLPETIDAFIGEYWLGELQASALDDDNRWKAARTTMDDLAWSIAPKKSPAERLKLVGLLPKLLAQLNKGLDTVAANSEARKAFFDTLVQYHSAALKGEVNASEATPAPEAKKEQASFDPTQEGDLLVTRSIDQGVEVEEVMLVGASPIWRADDREIFRQVSELKRGDWVEFREFADTAVTDETSDTNASGEECTRSTRERLNWISPQRGILLFSNHRSSKAISIAPEALARQIRDGKAEIIREAPLFERALSGALETMNAH